LTVSCPVSVLAPGGSMTCTATYVVTQADVDAGSVVNTATVSGAPPVGAVVTSDPASVTVPITAAPELTVVKSALPVSVSAAGESVAYSFVVSNTGNVTLTGVSVADTLTAPAGPALTVSCPVSVLAPGGSMTCTATYVVTQADVDAGSVVNTATVSGTWNCPVDEVGVHECTVTSDGSTFGVDIPRRAALILDKQAQPPVDADGDGRTGAGDIIRYLFRITNTGNVTLTAVTVSDPKVGPVSCPTAALPPGSSLVCGAVDYRITDADVAAGSVVNRAEASARAPSGAAVPAVSVDSTTTPVQGRLAQTGAEVARMGLAGLILIGAGLALITGTRRRREEQW
jgi:uncharacterized repeat protein (TIGR01451 family)